MHRTDAMQSVCAELSGDLLLQALSVRTQTKQHCQENTCGTAPCSASQESACRVFPGTSSSATKIDKRASSTRLNNSTHCAAAPSRPWSAPGPNASPVLSPPSHQPNKRPGPPSEPDLVRRSRRSKIEGTRLIPLRHSGLGYSTLLQAEQRYQQVSVTPAHPAHETRASSG